MIFYVYSPEKEAAWNMKLYTVSCQVCFCLGVVGRSCNFIVDFPIRLNLLQRLIPFGQSHDAEMLVQQDSVKLFNKTVPLRPSDFSSAMFNLLNLQKLLVRMIVRSR
jgi:hypothetical protein